MAKRQKLPKRGLRAAAGSARAGWVSAEELASCPTVSGGWGEDPSSPAPPAAADPLDPAPAGPAPQRTPASIAPADDATVPGDPDAPVTIILLVGTPLMCVNRLAVIITFSAWEPCIYRMPEPDRLGDVPPAPSQCTVSLACEDGPSATPSVKNNGVRQTPRENHCGLARWTAGRGMRQTPLISGGACGSMRAARLND